MTAYERLANTLPGHVLMIAALLLLVWALYLCILTVFHRRRPAAAAAAIALLIVGGFLFCLLLDGIFLAEYMWRYYGAQPRDWPEPVKAIYRLPWAVIALGEAVYGALCALIGAACLRHRRTHVSEQSVKQMLDLLPMGVCVADGEGTVLLSNLRMAGISQKLTGMPLNRFDRLQDAVRAESRPEGSERLLTEPDGEALLFADETIHVDEREYQTLTATDVTERYRITRQLLANNRRLKDIQLRIKSFRVESSELLLSRELLRARTTVHDEVGHILLRTGRYLSRPNAEDGAQLLALARRTNDLLLREAEAPEESLSDPWQEALNVAQGIGAELRCTGTPPAEPGLRALASQALRECAANTVKHSASAALDVSFSEDGGWTMTLANEAPGPETEVKESGGLLSLRRMAEAEGVRMEVRSAPSFTVVLSG